ncbi:hypothetical protein [Natronorubrum aibiense]|uniref:Uncharacterized protein n=1 Tax=Natronorubrum aibiense TaxID=348826 RepID=A0A5P9P288_9EURY|nr:hypothetical protein [Natronorubrum aibiense]QFU82207.1 hypothetical protein GCU68_06515 [Natronorubrum aibiense]
MDVEECDETTAHVLSDGTSSTNHGGTDTGDCGISYCRNTATYLVVHEPARSDRQRERYCESHVALAADDVRADPARELVCGPVVLE